MIDVQECERPRAGDREGIQKDRIDTHHTRDDHDGLDDRHRLAVACAAAADRCRGRGDYRRADWFEEQALKARQLS